MPCWLLCLARNSECYNYTVPASVSQCAAQNQGNVNCMSRTIISTLALRSIQKQAASSGRTRFGDTTRGMSPAKRAARTVLHPQVSIMISATAPNFLGKLVGFGQKSGIYWALDPANGNIV